MLGLKSFATAAVTLSGIELAHRIRKRQFTIPYERSVAIPVGCLNAFERFEPGCVRLLTWAGLRGALAIALALALPTDSPARAPIVTATYAIALFSTLVQAMTVEPLARRWTQRSKSIK
jgi:NhaP-type Na+/H+ or K+/H+ antiporter